MLKNKDAQLLPVVGVLLLLCEVLCTTTDGNTMASSISVETITPIQQTTPKQDHYPRNVALEGTASHLESFNFVFLWDAEFAIDGNSDGTAPDTSRTCSNSVDNPGGSANFWRVDFQQQYAIMKIIIFGRSNVGVNLEGFEVYAGNTSDTPVYRNTEGYGDGHFEIDLEPEVDLSSLIIRRPGQQYIELCEVEAYEACPNGVYGTNCTEECGKCLVDGPCYKVTGTCPNGCAAGWNGSLCKTACEPHTHGNNCNETCGHCLGGVACDIFDGSCPGECEPGFQGIDCKQVTTTTTQVSENPTSQDSIETTTDTAPITGVSTVTMPTTADSISTQSNSSIATEANTQDSDTLPLIVGVSAGAGFLLIAGIIGALVYRFKSRKEKMTLNDGSNLQQAVATNGITKNTAVVYYKENPY